MSDQDVQALSQRLRVLAEQASRKQAQVEASVGPIGWSPTLMRSLREEDEAKERLAAACDPGTITALLDRLDALEAVAEAAKSTGFHSIWCRRYLTRDEYGSACFCGVDALRDALSRLDGGT